MLSILPQGCYLITRCDTYDGGGTFLTVDNKILLTLLVLQDFSRLGENYLENEHVVGLQNGTAVGGGLRLRVSRGNASLEDWLAGLVAGRTRSNPCGMKYRTHRIIRCPWRASVYSPVYSL